MSAAARAIAVIGIDIGMNSFPIVGLDQRGASSHETGEQQTAISGPRLRHARVGTAVRFGQTEATDLFASDTPPEEPLLLPGRADPPDRPQRKMRMRGP